MQSIDEYINSIQEFKNNHQDLTELEFIRYVYINLGSYVSFNEKFKPFGNSKLRSNIYKYHSRNKADLDECIKERKVICKSLAYILEIILKSFSVNIETIIEEDKYINYPHVYNEITLKDGTVFVLDLQEDLYNIQSHFYTKNFGIDSIYDMKPIVNRNDVENIDRKIGYINDEIHYSDEYLYLLHLVTDGINDLEEKLDFILDNIDIYNVSNMGYTDLQWHHKCILEEFFTKDEFGYLSDTGVIKIVNTFKNNKYYNVISLYKNNNTIIYIYNRKKNKYSKMSLSHFANSVKNGLVVYKTNVPGLVRELRKKGN